MKFIQTPLNGSFLIEIEEIKDERGFFARTWNKQIFEKHGLNTNLEQCNVSYNKKKGTLRGMHFQISPYQEVKIVRCTKGRIFDVIIDLRSKSPTYKKWTSFELTEKNHKLIYVPEGFAHGLMTLEDDTEIFYQVSQKYMPEFERIIKWNDPTFNISWPMSPKVISEKDKSAKFFTDKSN